MADTPAVGNASVAGNNVTGVNLTTGTNVMNNQPATPSAESGTTFISNNPMSSFFMPDGSPLVFGADGKYTTNDEAQIEELSKACLSSYGAIRKE